MGRPAELPSRSRLHGAVDLDLGGDDWQAGNPPRVPSLVDLLPLQRLPHLDLAGGSEDHNTETASSQAVSSFLLPIRSRRWGGRTLWEGERHAKAIAFWYLPFFNGHITRIAKNHFNYQVLPSSMGWWRRDENTGQ